MATIKPYVATSTAAGQRVELKAKKAVIWLTVGQGEVNAFEPYKVNVAGKIDILGYKGDMLIDLHLTDEDPASKSGPCVLKLNKHVDEQATYTANGRDLLVRAVLGGHKQDIQILQANNGAQTECKLSGKVNQTVHLAPVR